MEGRALIEKISDTLACNSNKLPWEFIEGLVNEADISYHKLTDNTRACVIKLKSEHEVVGIAQVLDSGNDVEAIGNSVALSNATNELWSAMGSIAKAVMD